MNGEELVYWLHNKEDVNVYTEGYIGITKSLGVRLRKHKSQGKKYDHMDILYQGPIHACRMIEYIFRPERNIGWNTAAGGNRSTLGYKHTPETKEKIRKAAIGRKHSESTKLKMRLARVRYKHSEETKRKISRAHIGMKKPWVIDMNQNRKEKMI